ncbi:hypothetical protein [Clostridium saccharoperbutylacetonicum]|uniref:hypothetical protein n=1 Tax=Clostridium saccharoperbutylacetonicum TaxID=36745 RepID=UPI0039EAADFB
MNAESMKKLVSSVIKNEFNHIQNAKEVKAIKDDAELSMLDKELSDLLEELCKAIPDFKDLIEEFDNVSTLYWSALCRYYFKMGVIAGATNLKFLEDITILYLA